MQGLLVLSTIGMERLATNECLKQKTVNIVEKDGDVVKDYMCGLDEDEDCEENEQEENTCLVRKLMLSPNCSDEN